jgi:predicted kinase
VIHIGSKIDDLHVVEQRLEARKRDIADQTNTIKQKMANAFEDIRQRLEKKERELMMGAD